jgi:hypothetical protein
MDIDDDDYDDSKENCDEDGGNEFQVFIDFRV